MSKYAIAILALAFSVFVFIDGCHDRKREKKIAALTEALNDCQHAPETRDTVIRTVTLRDTVRLLAQTPNTSHTVTVTREIPVRDTVIREQEITGLWKTDYFTMTWRALVFGELRKFEILPPSEYRWPEVTIEKTVTVPGDCPKPKKAQWVVMIGPGLDFGGLQKEGESKNLFKLWEARLLYQRKAVGIYAGGGIVDGNSGIFTTGIALRIR